MYSSRMPNSMFFLHEMVTCALIEVDPDEEPNAIQFIGTTEQDVVNQLVAWKLTICSEFICTDTLEELMRCSTSEEVTEWHKRHHARFAPSFTVFKHF